MRWRKYIMPIDKSKITKEMLEKALHCKTPEELIALTKIEGLEITKEQAEAYLDELHNIELDKKTLEKIAGGSHIKNIKSCNKDLSLPRPGYD